MTLNTPFGMPASSANAARARALRGRRFAGCPPPGIPPKGRRALRVIMAFGKFQGVMAATTRPRLLDHINRLSACGCGMVPVTAALLVEPFDEAPVGHFPWPASAVFPARWSSAAQGRPVLEKPGRTSEATGCAFLRRAGQPARDTRRAASMARRASAAPFIRHAPITTVGRW
jgi:hypothetical protein